MEKDYFTRWLREHNPPAAEGGSDEAWERTRDIFVRSCAGYCVATHVLGIGGTILPAVPLLPCDVLWSLVILLT